MNDSDQPVHIYSLSEEDLHSGLSKTDVQDELRFFSGIAITIYPYEMAQV